MKHRRKPVSMTRNVKSKTQMFREVELKGISVGRCLMFQVRQGTGTKSKTMIG